MAASPDNVVAFDSAKASTESDNSYDEDDYDFDESESVVTPSGNDADDPIPF